MAKLLPFVVRPRTEIVPVGNTEIGIIHLLKKRGISPNENPTDLQQAAIRQARAALLVEAAVKRLCEVESVTRKEARKRLFAVELKDAETGEDTESETSMYDYLSPEEATELLSLRDSDAQVAIKAATLMVRYRVAYPLTVLKTIKPSTKPTTVDIEPLAFPLAAGDRIEIGEVKYTLATAAEEGSESLELVSIPAAIEKGAIAYVLTENGRRKLGSPDWEIADTEGALTEELILEIYNFFRMEAGNIPDVQEAAQLAGGEDEGKTSISPPSNNLPASNQSNGAISIGDSVATVA